MLTLATAQKKRLTVLLAWLCLTSAIPAATQQASAPAATQDQINQQLLQRVQELEKEVQQLKGQPVTAPAPPVSPAPAPVAPAVAEAPSVNEVAPRLKFNVFGDVGWQIYNGSDSTFFFGSFDMFMTARLSDKVSALGEVLFLPNIADNSVGVDVTRLLLTYRQSEYFRASVGR